MVKKIRKGQTKRHAVSLKIKNWNGSILKVLLFKMTNDEFPDPELIEFEAEVSSENTNR